MSTVSRKIIDILIQADLTYTEADVVLDEVRTEISRNYFPMLERITEEQRERLKVKNLIL